MADPQRRRPLGIPFWVWVPALVGVWSCFGFVQVTLDVTKDVVRRLEGTPDPRPAVPAPAPAIVREFKVRIAFDEEWREQIDAEAIARRRLAAASAVFEREFGIRWSVVGVAQWTSDDDTLDLSDVLDGLREAVPPDSADLVLGFSGRARAKGAGRDYSLGGIADFYGPAALVRRTSSSEQNEVELLVHELSHVLGAWHSPDRSSRMYPDGDGTGKRFDATSRRAIEIGRDLDLRKGLAGVGPDARRRIAEAYRTSHMAWEALPYVYAGMGEDPRALGVTRSVESARAAYQAAIAEQAACMGPDDPSLADGLRRLAWAWLEEPDSDLAEAESLAMRARKVSEDRHVDESPLLESRLVLAEIAARRGHLEEAVGRMDAVAKEREKRFGAYYPETANARRRADVWRAERTRRLAALVAGNWSQGALTLVMASGTPAERFEDVAPGMLHVRFDEEATSRALDADTGETTALKLSARVRGPGLLVMAFEEEGTGPAAPIRRMELLLFGAEDVVHQVRADLAFTLTGGECSDDARFQWTGSIREGDDPAHERRAVFTSRVPWRKAVRIQRILASPSGPAVALPAAGSDLATWEWIDAGGPPVAIQLPEASSGSGPTGSRTGGTGLLRRWRLTASFRPAETK